MQYPLNFILFPQIPQKFKHIAAMFGRDWLSAYRGHRCIWGYEKSIDKSQNNYPGSMGLENIPWKNNNPQQKSGS